jgi:hypothetical protein
MFSLLGFGFALVSSLLSMSPFFPFGMGMYLCHCMSEVCNLIFKFYRGSQVVAWVTEATLDLSFWAVLEFWRLWGLLEMDLMYFTFWEGHKLLGARGVMLWFEYEMFPTSSCIGGLVASWWAFGTWLDTEGYDLIKELIFWWINKMMTLGGCKSRRWGLVGGSRSVGMCSEKIYPVTWPFLSHFLCFLSTGRQEELLCSPICSLPWCSSLIPDPQQWNHLTLEWNLWSCEPK